MKTRMGYQCGFRIRDLFDCSEKKFKEKHIKALLNK